MKKTLHRYLVKVTDDAFVSNFTRWKLMHVEDTRRAAWDNARRLLKHHWRHVQVIEERRYAA